jgi:hypothetical protein
LCILIVVGDDSTRMAVSIRYTEMGRVNKKSLHPKRREIPVRGI